MADQTERILRMLEIPPGKREALVAIVERLANQGHLLGVPAATVQGRGLHLVVGPPSGKAPDAVPAIEVAALIAESETLSAEATENEVSARSARLSKRVKMVKAFDVLWFVKPTAADLAVFDNADRELKLLLEVL